MTPTAPSSTRHAATSPSASTPNRLKDRRRLDGRPLAPITRELYRSLFDRHLIKPFGSKRLNAIRTEEIRGWHSNLAARSSPVQAAKTYRLLRAILNTAVEDERIAANPCRLRGAGTERTPERPFVDVEIVLALSDTIDARYCALVLLADPAVGQPIGAYLESWLSQTLPRGRPDACLARRLIGAGRHPGPARDSGANLTT